jgi:hypothetical protein
MEVHQCNVLTDFTTIPVEFHSKHNVYLVQLESIVQILQYLVVWLLTAVQDMCALGVRVNLSLIILLWEYYVLLGSSVLQVS